MGISKGRFLIPLFPNPLYLKRVAVATLFKYSLFFMFNMQRLATDAVCHLAYYQVLPSSEWRMRNLVNLLRFPIMRQSCVHGESGSTTSMITVDVTANTKILYSPIILIQDGVILFWNLDKRFYVSHCCSSLVYSFAFPIL